MHEKRYRARYTQQTLQTVIVGWSDYSSFFFMYKRNIPKVISNDRYRAVLSRLRAYPRFRHRLQNSRTFSDKFHGEPAAPTHKGKDGRGALGRKKKRGVYAPRKPLATIDKRPKDFRACSIFKPVGAYSTLPPSPTLLPPRARAQTPRRPGYRNSFSSSAPPAVISFRSQPVFRGRPGGGCCSIRTYYSLVHAELFLGN